MKSKIPPPKELDPDEFKYVIDKTPLVSIDLVIKNSRNEILLGLRTEEPAKDTWFVPGGRFLKYESVESKFKKIALDELDKEITIDQSRFLGPHTHIYPTNRFNEPNIDTHYVALGYEIIRDDIDVEHLNNLCKKGKIIGHSKFSWFTTEEQDTETHKLGFEVHPNCRSYFGLPTRLSEEQYRTMNARRDSYNTLVWQTPVLSLTAQAFLFRIILSDNSNPCNRIIACILAVLTAFASIQLLGKHWFYNNHHAKILSSYENIMKLYPANQKKVPDNWFQKIPSHIIWTILLYCFMFTSLISMFLIGFGMI